MSAPAISDINQASAVHSDLSDISKMRAAAAAIGWSARRAIPTNRSHYPELRHFSNRAVVLVPDIEIAIRTKGDTGRSGKPGCAASAVHATGRSVAGDGRYRISSDIHFATSVILAIHHIQDRTCPRAEHSNSTRI